MLVITQMFCNDYLISWKARLTLEFVTTYVLPCVVWLWLMWTMFLSIKCVPLYFIVFQLLLSLKELIYYSDFSVFCLCVVVCFQVYLAVLDCLPLQKDLEEVPTVFNCIDQLYQSGYEAVLILLCFHSF